MVSVHNNVLHGFTSKLSISCFRRNCLCSNWNSQEFRYIAIMNYYSKFYELRIPALQANVKTNNCWDFEWSLSYLKSDSYITHMVLNCGYVTTIAFVSIAMRVAAVEEWTYLRIAHIVIHDFHLKVPLQSHCTFTLVMLRRYIVFLCFWNTPQFQCSAIVYKAAKTILQSCKLRVIYILVSPKDSRFLAHHDGSRSRFDNTDYWIVVATFRWSVGYLLW